MNLMVGHAVFVLTQFDICMFTKLSCSLAVIICRVCFVLECKRGDQHMYQHDLEI